MSVTGMTLKAFERVWELTGDAKYFDFIKLNMSRHIHADGTIEQYVLEDYNLDNINQGKLLYLMLRQPAIRASRKRSTCWPIN